MNRKLKKLQPEVKTEKSPTAETSRKLQSRIGGDPGKPGCEAAIGAWRRRPVAMRGRAPGNDGGSSYRRNFRAVRNRLPSVRGLGLRP